MTSDQVLVGELGLTTMRIRGGTLPGEVKVIVNGIAHYYLAYCPDPVPAGADVLVINCRGARQIDVELWETL